MMGSTRLPEWSRAKSSQVRTGQDTPTINHRACPHYAQKEAYGGGHGKSICASETEGKRANALSVPAQVRSLKSTKKV